MTRNNNYGYYTEGTYFIGSNNSIYSNDIFIVFFRKLFPGKRIIAIGRESTTEFSPKFSLPEKSSLVGLSYYKSITRLFLILPWYILKNKKKIISFIDNVDILFISSASPLSVYLLKKMRKENKKVILFIRQDTRKLIKVRFNNFFLANIMVNWAESRIEDFVRKYSKVTTFTFGNEIYERYSKLSNLVYPIADSRYHDKDVLKITELKACDYSSINFLYVGRLEKGKGLEFLIESLTEIKQFKFKLSIVGEGSLKKELVSIIKIFHLTDKVEFKGAMYFDEGLMNEYTSHDVLILPSFSEGLPQVILEAMARGTLVIATKVGGIPDLIVHEVNGFLFEPGNKIELLKIINDIHSGTVDVFSIRKNGLATAKKNSLENQSKRIYNHLKID